MKTFTFKIQDYEFLEIDLIFANRFSKDTTEINELNEEMQIELNNSGNTNILTRVIKNSNNYHNQDKNSLRISDIIEGLTDSGNVVESGLNSTLSNFKAPPGCPYTGKLQYDVRCRKWYLQTSTQNRLTPIEPTLVFGDFPYLAGNLCKSKRKQEKDANGNLFDTNCTYSTNCISFALSAIKNYFTQAKYSLSTTFMIEPRSQIIIYNQLQNLTLNITYLVNATNQIFPNDTQLQDEFLQKIRSKILRVKNQSYNNTQYQLDRLIQDDKNECKVNPFKIIQQLKFKSINFGDYAFMVPKINIKEEEEYQNYNRQSFILRPGQKEETFVIMNYVYIIEKLLDRSHSKSYEIQDLFIIIDILPKHMLTNQTDKLKAQINLFLMWVSISSLILCGLLIIIIGIISYKVAVMIEKPLIHMTDMLNKLDNEGCSTAKALIDSQITQHDSIFLSKDSAILFESFRAIFEMLHLATEDVFTVEDSCSLLRLNYQINFFKEFNNIRVLGICYNNMGNIHFQNGRYLESMEAYQNSIILAQQEAGFYQEQQQEDSYFSCDELQLFNKEMKELQKEEGSKRSSESKQGLLSSIYSKLKSISISLMEKRISQQCHQDNLKVFSKDTLNDIPIATKRNYSYSSETIKEIIFYRKLNLSNAFYMHNITQETEEMSNRNKINKNILNNPINYQGNQCTRAHVSFTKIMFDWENYEDILLDLLKLNSELITRSFGRTVILLTQLSLCHLKMGQIVKASEEQSLAIDYYQCAVTQELIKKTNHTTEETNTILKSQIDQLKLNINQSIIHSRLQFQEIDHSNFSPQISPLLNSQKESPIEDTFNKIETLNFLQEHQETDENKDKYYSELNEELFSLKNMLKKRQFSSITRRISNKSRANFAAEPPMNKSFRGKNYLLEKNNNGDSMEEIKQLEMNNSKQKSLKNNLQNSPGDRSQQTTSNQLDMEEKNQKNELMNKHSVNTSERRVSTKQNSNKLPRSNKFKMKTISSFQNKSTHKFSMSRKQTESKERESLKSKVNKQFKQEELELIQKYELPTDILLYYIALQESRLLFFENHELSSALILTDLLEKTKYYLPYYRLASLNILRNLNSDNKQMQGQINKMMQRFDLDIQLNASIAVVVKSGMEDAIQTLLHILNDVFTKDDDIISLLLYKQSNFQQILPSISLKQIRLTDGYLESFLSQIHQKSNYSQRQLPVLGMNELLRSPSVIQKSFLNQKQLIDVNQEINCSGEKRSPLLQISSFLDCDQIENKYLTLKKIDILDCQSRRSSFSLEALERNPLIQQVPQFKGISTILELQKSLIREERKGNSIFSKNNDHLNFEVSPPITFKHHNSSHQEDTKNGKSQSFAQEEENCDLLLNDKRRRSSRLNLLQNQMKKEQSCSSNGLQSTSPHLNSESYLVKSTDEIRNNNKTFTFFPVDKKIQTSKKSFHKFTTCQKTKFSKEKVFKQNGADFDSTNFIFHLAIRKCLQNFFSQSSNKYEMEQKLIKKDMISNQKKFVIFITDQFEILFNQAYKILSNLLYSTQTQLLILLLNKEEQLQESCLFKDVQINGQTVIKYFYTQDHLLQYIRNKREPMKNFGVPFLVEHLNM